MAGAMNTGMGAVRAAEALLHCCGGEPAALRMPAAAASGDDAEQLGLATPAFNDVPLGPAAFSPTNTGGTLLLSGAVVEKATAAAGESSVAALWQQAAGVLLGDVLYAIAGAVALRNAGAVYAWRLTLTAPVS